MSATTRLIATAALILAGCARKLDATAEAGSFVESVLGHTGTEDTIGRVACPPEMTRDAVVKQLQAAGVSTCRPARLTVATNSSDEPEAKVVCADGRALHFYFHVAKGSECGLQNRGVIFSAIVMESSQPR